MSRTMPKAAPAGAKGLAPGHPCLGCGAKCCRYLSILTPAPSDRDEYHLIRWYLTHETVSVFIDERGHWYVYVAVRCRHLGKGDRCRIYERRPRVCREYAAETCEHRSDADDNIAEFDTPEQFERFFRRNFRWNGDRALRRHRRWRTVP